MFTYENALQHIRLIRLRINDKYADNPIFQDEELEDLYLLEGGDLRCAAALALETIAADQVLVQKVIKLGNLSTDGAKVAAELRANAALLRSQSADAGGDSADPGFEIAEQVYDVFSEREYIEKWYERR